MKHEYECNVGDGDTLTVQGFQGRGVLFELTGSDTVVLNADQLRELADVATKAADDIDLESRRVYCSSSREDFIRVSTPDDDGTVGVVIREGDGLACVNLTQDGVRRLIWILRRGLLDGE